MKLPDRTGYAPAAPGTDLFFADDGEARFVAKVVAWRLRWADAQPVLALGEQYDLEDPRFFVRFAEGHCAGALGHFVGVPAYLKALREVPANGAATGFVDEPKDEDHRAEPDVDPDQVLRDLKARGTH